MIFSQILYLCNLNEYLASLAREAKNNLCVVFVTLPYWYQSSVLPVVMFSYGMSRHLFWPFVHLSVNDIFIRI